MTHYLLRQKPYHVMWLGDYVVIDNNIDIFSREEELYGISTVIDYDEMSDNIDNLEEQSYFSKIKFIGDNHSRWNIIDVLNDALNYFDLYNSKTVNYSGYLLNHTEQLAVDLNDYFTKSVCITDNGELYAFDLIPFLTETGGGSPMALYKGISVDTTEQLIRTWCGDLLQIVEQLPADFRLIDCCFAEYLSKSYINYLKFGLDTDNYILQNNKGERYTCVGYVPFLGGRASLMNVKAVSRNAGKITFNTELIKN
jgi:hypothetical protein